MSVSVIDVVSGDELSLHCSVDYADYFGYLTPHYDWTVLALNDSERVPITSENSGEAYVTASWPTVPQLHCSVYFNRSAESSYSDAASNSPSYRGNCTTDAIDVLSPPHDVRIDDTSTDVAGSRRLICSAAGRPAPTYEWYRVRGDDDDQRLVSGDLLTVNDAGRHEVRCTAVNVIRGVTHSMSSDTVVVGVLSPRHQNDTEMIIDSDVGRNRNNDRTATESVNETTVFNDNAMSRSLINNPYFVPTTSAVAAVLLFIAVSIVVVVRCRRRTKQQNSNVGSELASAALSTSTSPNRHGDGQRGEQTDHGNERIVGDERSSALYDEIGSSCEFTQPQPAAAEQYNRLLLSDDAPAAAPGTNVDVYSPLQRDANNTLTKITIAVGKCDVSIVFSGDSTAQTVPSIQRADAD